MTTLLAPGPFRAGLNLVGGNTIACHRRISYLQKLVAYQQAGLITGPPASTYHVRCVPSKSLKILPDALENCLAGPR